MCDHVLFHDQRVFVLCRIKVDARRGVQHEEAKFECFTLNVSCPHFCASQYCKSAVSYASRCVHSFEMRSHLVPPDRRKQIVQLDVDGREGQEACRRCSRYVKRFRDSRVAIKAFRKRSLG